MRSNPNDPASSAGSPDYARLLRGLLAILLIYGLLGALGVVLRAELRAWGFAVDDDGHPVLERALAFHAVLAAIALVGLVGLRGTPPLGRCRQGCRLLVGMTPVLLLVSADLLVTIDFAPPPVQEAAVLMRDARRLWRYEPGSRGTRCGAAVEINAHGLRGPAVPFERRADEYRVLFLGDSTTFGCGVAWEDTFVAQVQQLLPRRHGRPLTVINAGVDGYTTWQELDLLSDEGLSYAPDLVVLGFCPNDLTDYERHQLVYTGGRWLKHSGLFRLMQHWRHGPGSLWASARRREFPPPALVELFAPEEPEAVRRGWEEALGDLERMYRLCRDHGTEFWLLYIPARDQVMVPDRFDDRPQRRLADFAAAHGVRLLDPLPRLLSLAPPERSECYIDAWHWTAAGHRAATGVLVEALGE